MNKRIILVGPTCSGKTYLREKFESKGFHFDVSYTSRPMREGEVHGTHYHFISKDKFIDMIKEGEFYEWVEYNGHYYGTGQWEWDNMEYFILETDGVAEIDPEDRKDCFIIYLNPPEIVRYDRMLARGWGEQTIITRIATDEKKFKDFTDYDWEVKDAEVVT